MLHLLHTNALAHRPVGAAHHRMARTDALARAKASHPAGSALAGCGLADEDGSLVTEYGLLAVVAATIAGVVMTWASGGALVTLFNALLRQARNLVGA